MEVRQEEEDFIKWQQRRADMERRLRRLRDQRWIRRWLNDEDVRSHSITYTHVCIFWIKFNVNNVQNG